jgi:hypothetical protein
MGTWLTCSSACTMTRLTRARSAAVARSKAS